MPMIPPAFLVSVPALREKDVAAMPRLRSLLGGAGIAELVPSFPAVTCPVQANMTTGRLPADHGVVANGFYWRHERRVEMWTSPNECVERPQLWDLLSQAGFTTAVWFPLHSKGCEADYVCTPAPIHHPDGSESLWCYTRPLDLYGELRDALGDFPLANYWGPMANIRSSRWIVQSALLAARRWRPDFFYIYLPHLDYAAQRAGPESEAAATAVAELDELLAELIEGMADAYASAPPTWLIAGEYAMTRVEHVCYPNRLLREAGLLHVRRADDGEYLDFETSAAWALADHQIAHVFVDPADSDALARAAGVFRGQPGVAEVLVGPERGRYALEHPRSGEIILVSTPESWMAYYWWLDEAAAPPLARTVDIHRKPGYDPVELYIDPETRAIPLDARLVKGSHGAPATAPSQRSVLLSSDPVLIEGTSLRDTDVFGAVMRHFGLQQ